MRQVKFQRYLDAKNILRVRFELEHGEVFSFSVQLECQFLDKWIPVVRYDTAHKFAHCDRLHPYEEITKTEMTTRDYNEALNFAINDLIKNWDKYRQRYEEWVKRK